MSRINLNLWPVFEMRPLPDDFVGVVRRFAGGAWIEDDGEHDLAFIGRMRSRENGAWGFPACLMVELPYQRNIVFSWLSGPWTGRTSSHPGGNPWHYQLRPGAKSWGGDWGSRTHPNRRAGDSGMSKMAGENGCSNGVHAELKMGNRWLDAGVVRNAETKEILRAPERPVCMYCGGEWREHVSPQWSDRIPKSAGGAA